MLDERHIFIMFVHEAKQITVESIRMHYFAVSSLNANAKNATDLCVWGMAFGVWARIFGWGFGQWQLVIGFSSQDRILLMLM